VVKEPVLRFKNSIRWGRKALFCRRHTRISHQIGRTGDCMDVLPIQLYWYRFL